MINKETVDKVVNALISSQTNNLAARISVMYNISSENPDLITMFREEQVYDVRKNTKKLKKYIDKDIFEEIMNICDYFESVLIASKL